MEDGSAAAAASEEGAAVLVRRCKTDRSSAVRGPAIVVDLPDPVRDPAVPVTTVENRRNLPSAINAVIVIVIEAQPNIVSGEVVPWSAVDPARRIAAETAMARALRLPVAIPPLFPADPERSSQVKTNTITAKKPRKNATLRDLPTPICPPMVDIPRRRAARRNLRPAARKSPRRARSIHPEATAALRIPATTTGRRKRRARARRRRSEPLRTN